MKNEIDHFPHVFLVYNNNIAFSTYLRFFTENYDGRFDLKFNFLVIRKSSYFPNDYEEDGNSLSCCNTAHQL